MKKMQSMPTQDCSNCTQKNALLHKYQSLISLYKKKQVKVSNSSLSLNTNNVLSSQTSQFNQQHQQANILALLLEQITRKRYIGLFDAYKQRSGKKLALLSLTSIVKKQKQRLGFAKICEYCPLPQQSETDKSDQPTNVTDEIKTISGWEEYKDCEGDTLVSSGERVRLIKKGLGQIGCKLATRDDNAFKKIRNFMEIEIINKKLSSEVRYLKKCLDQSNRRQQKQNQKKKDSLEMLAQQLCQKNQIINQIQRSLRAYQQRYFESQNVLQEDTIELRKQVDHLEIVRDKLNDQLFKLRQHLSANKLKLQQKQKNIQKLEKQYQQLADYKIKHEQQQNNFRDLNTNFEKLVKNFSNKLKRLSIYQNQLQQSNLHTNKTVSIKQQAKTEMVLSFLANINLKDYQLKYPKLFDDQEKQFLAEHKQKYIQLTEEANILNKTSLLPEAPKLGDIKAISNDFNDSIFSVIQNSGPKNSSSIAKQQRQCLSDRQGITMKIMELQLDKSKQVYKISELKQKIMHIRALIMRLLRSLQLQQNALKPETQGVLRVFFDMFEYSEQERFTMFMRKKRLFGLI